MIDKKRGAKDRRDKFVSQADEMEFLSIEEINKLKLTTLVELTDEDHELDLDEIDEVDQAEGGSKGLTGSRHQITAVDLKAGTVAELLKLHADVLEELRNRNILRSANGPTGDFAEYLLCTCYGWTQENKSAKAFDARGADGVRYQIKGRRIHRRNKSRQLSAIRDLEGFDVLAAVLFDDDYRIIRAALIPAGVIREQSTFSIHTNSHKFMLRDAIWDLPDVLDATDRLRTVEYA